MMEREYKSPQDLESSYDHGDEGDEVHLLVSDNSVGDRLGQQGFRRVVRKEVIACLGDTLNEWYEGFRKLEDNCEEANQIARHADQKADSLVAVFKILDSRVTESENVFANAIEKSNETTATRMSKMDSLITAKVETSLIALEENWIAPQLATHAEQIIEIQQRLDINEHLDSQKLISEGYVENNFPRTLLPDDSMIRSFALSHLPSYHGDRLPGASGAFKTQEHMIISFQSHCRGQLARLWVIGCSTTRPGMVLHGASGREESVIRLQQLSRGFLCRRLVSRLRSQISQSCIFFQAHCRGSLSRRRTIHLRTNFPIIHPHQRTRYALCRTSIAMLHLQLSQLKSLIVSSQPLVLFRACERLNTRKCFIAILVIVTFLLLSAILLMRLPYNTGGLSYRVRQEIRTSAWRNAFRA